LLVGVQSFCLYSAVAIIPVALALLAFNTFPMLFMLLTWAAGGDDPGRRAFVAMPLALFGLVLALDILGTVEAMTGRWAEIGIGVSWALGAAASFALVLFLTTRHLKEVDGRMRTLLTMGATAVAVGLAGAATQKLALPTDGTGWLGLVLLTVLYGSAITAMFTVVPRIGAASNTAALNFEPVAALILGWVILGQSMEPRQLVGAFIVVGAVILIGTKRH
jgi:drug/metabolite transporter (DMT)-like permease